MFDLFANPWTMAAGALLVAAPIVIHLINRIRFKRVRWAAMEFLLKAQKRVRRKLLIQQLILLAMRCLMVLLLGLLFARLLDLGSLGRLLGLGVNANENRPTAHVVILDDSPSMADPWRGDDGVATDSFSVARTVLADQIARAAAEASAPQEMEVRRLSDLNAPHAVGRLNTQSIEGLRQKLGTYQPALTRVGLVNGLKKTKELLAEQTGDVARVVHVLSDFRSVDWATDGEAIRKEVEDLTGGGTKVYLIDVAHPYRKRDDRRAPLAHDNVTILELTPSRPVAPRYEDVEFTLRVRNNGNTELKNLRFAVKVNGDENKGRSVSIASLPGRQTRTEKFELPLDQLGSDERPLDRFSLVTVGLASDEPGGIAADNVRHAVVEVKTSLPILVLEGRPALKESKDGDGFYLRNVFNSVLRGYTWVDGTPRDLEQQDLRRYAFVMLLNVPTLSEAAAKNLEQYAAGGGGVGFFLGPDVTAKDYNALLYLDGAGLFPAPLAEKPSEEQTEDELEARRVRIGQKKVLLRDPALRTHPALESFYFDARGEESLDGRLLERFYNFVLIKRYWPIPKVGKWRDDPAVRELYCLPNELPMASYEAPGRRIADQLPVEDPEFEKYKALLAERRTFLRQIVTSSDPLYKLAWELDGLLGDEQGGGAEVALMREFWQVPKMAGLKAEVVRLRNVVKFGDPLYLAKDFGLGRVTVMTTTAGETWTNWPSEQPGNSSFSPLVKEMANYLGGARAKQTYTLGDPIEARFPAARYKPTANRVFVTHDPLTGGGRGAATPLTTTDLKDQPLESDADGLVLRFTEAVNPGGYLFTFTANATSESPDAAEPKEYRGFAANLDAREGDLARALTDDLRAQAPGAEIHSPADPDWVTALRNKQTDFSETLWPYLMLLGLLLAEGYMAMRLSFHAAASEIDLAAPSAAAVLHSGSNVHREEAT